MGSKNLKKYENGLYNTHDIFVDEKEGLLIKSANFDFLSKYGLINEYLNLFILNKLRDFLLNENKKNEELYKILSSFNFPKAVWLQNKNNVVQIAEEFIKDDAEGNLRKYFEDKLMKKKYEEFIEEFRKFSYSLASLAHFKNKVAYLHRDFKLRHLIFSKNTLYLVDHENGIFGDVAFMLSKDYESNLKELIIQKSKEEHRDLIDQELKYIGYAFFNKFSDDTGLEKVKNYALHTYKEIYNSMREVYEELKVNPFYVIGIFKDVEDYLRKSGIKIQGLIERKRGVYIKYKL